MWNFQTRVMAWARRCFGEDERKWNSPRERCNRFIEEALELCQSLGMPREDAHKIVDYVYNRPIGVPRQEVGGTMVTLAVLCEIEHIDLVSTSEAELERCFDKIEIIRKKQATKKADSALPQGD